MDKVIPGLILAALVLLIFTVMWRSWRRRSSVDAEHGVTAIPSSFSPTAEFDVQYVATTRAGEPLERLALPGLAFRGTGRLQMAPSGIALGVDGEQPVFVPGSALRNVDTSNVVIDRVVEPGGLVRISWTLADGTLCDSYVRLREPSNQPTMCAAISNLIQNVRDHSDRESESNA
ncbi:hypothetical protein [Paramicrobacterium agarici]|uniref:PH-like domain-containing protein n=1 Tax=Paramicrobacterium agarici TaxID=630514 RepID=UPI00114D870B|nr:hypothetical protein [Microbacterium agarici]TQO24419.1 hypothetical protein FB385_3308 [Microbacterium agarici]